MHFLIIFLFNLTVPKGAVVRPKGDNQEEARRVRAIPKLQGEQEKDEQRTGTLPKLLDHEIDMSSLDVYSMPSPPPPPPPPLTTESVIVEPTSFRKGANFNPPKKSPVPPTFAKTFTIASLQQYTNSFSQENLIGLGMLGTVYKAELPDGKVFFHLNCIDVCGMMKTRRHWLFVCLTCLLRCYGL